MMFKKIIVFKERPAKGSLPRHLRKLSEAEREGKLDDIYASTAKKHVEHWLTLDRRWSFGTLQPSHPELYSANAIISSIVDLWPGKDYWSLSPYFKLAKDWEVSLIHGFSQFLLSKSEADATALADQFAFGDHQFEIRAEFLRQSKVWEGFEANANAFISAMDAYERGPNSTIPIFETLQSMNKPDVILWHDIVTNMGHLNPDRVKAIEWILAQPACDRATVAAFLHVGIEFSMWEEIHSYPNGEFERLLDVIDRWNLDFYQNCNLSAHDKSNDVAVDPMAFPAMYRSFWKAVFADQAEHLPIPQSKPLDRPNKSALSKYAKPSGFEYSAENEALTFEKGRPQKRTYFPGS